MLSICIPVYNFEVTLLVEELHRQMKMIPVPAELILIDDCSLPEYKRLNEASCRRHRYIELPENVGRARIRNLFPQHARFECLLFLDCDSYVITDDFLRIYLEEIQKEDFSIIFGGRVYPKERPGREQLLSWKYGVYRESKSAAERRLNPSKSFMTNNFVVRKPLLEKIRFDERLVNYGHEDTLFGIALAEAQIPITHIENPVLNGHIETNEVYLKKTEESIHNLLFIEKNSNRPELLVQHITLISFYRKLEQKKMLGLLLLLYFLFRKPLRGLLQAGYVSLALFSFYKLGYYAASRHRASKKPSR